jgi:2-oxoisovalerate dehydrogenase E2 component (dihydrolipoyl transacylase)
MIKEMKLNITDISGSGKDGRVLKEDVQRHAERQKQMLEEANTFSPTPFNISSKDKTFALTGVRAHMFKTMTASLSIPHFLYSDSIDLTSLTSLRSRVNKGATPSKLTALPFIIKAVSLALQHYPLLNAHLDTSGPKPEVTQISSHNIGFAVDSPAGLLVPVIKKANLHSVESLTVEILRLSELAKLGKLGNADLAGATFTVSNIGSIGGGVVSPVIVPPQVAILAIGKSRIVPAFSKQGDLIKKEECIFSWAADHRVIDGALAARCAAKVKEYLEDTEKMLVKLR